MLILIDGKRGIEDIARELRETAGRDFSVSMVEGVLDDYFIPNGFVSWNGADFSESKGPVFLRARLPLFSQESLRPVTNALQILFAKPVFTALILLSLIVPLHTFFLNGTDIRLIGNVGGLQLLAAYGIVLLTSFLHELGHSSACVHFGVKHGDVGLAFYLFFPVLYADVSEVWNLNRKQRAVVDAGGIYFQTLCLPVLCLLYAATKSIIVLFAIYATALTIVTAMNPFLRFDGYWLLSDLFGVSNLRKKSIDAIDIFRKRGTKKRGAERLPPGARSNNHGIAVTVYAGLSATFFVILFVQVAFFLEKSLRKAAGALGVLFDEVKGANGPLDLAAVLSTMDAMIPTLLFVVPFFAWAIVGTRYLIKSGNRSGRSNCSSQARA